MKLVIFSYTYWSPVWRLWGKCLFRSLTTFFFFSAPWLFWIGLFVCLFIVTELCEFLIFLIETPYQIYGLQNFPSTSFSHLCCTHAMLNHKPSLLKVDTSHNLIMLFLLAETIFDPYFILSVVLFLSFKTQMDYSSFWCLSTLI